MSGNPRQIFRGITRAIFTRLRRRASRVGIHVASPQGEVLKDGVMTPAQNYLKWNAKCRSGLMPTGSKQTFVSRLRQPSAQQRNATQEKPER
jgi:hypothetical protein